jgi:hypothetical protein
VKWQSSAAAACRRLTTRGVFRFIEDHGIDLSRLVTGTVALEDASGVLEHMGEFKGVGVTVIDR